MTNRELKEFLGTLTEEQLDQAVLLQSEWKGYDVIMPEIMEEDYINPSGEGAEPISLYPTDPEDPDYCDITDEPIVIKKGSVMYFLE